MARRNKSELFLSAEASFLEEDYTAALEIYQQLLENPGDNKPRILEKMGWCYYLLNQNKTALRYFEWLISIEPYHVTANSMAALCALEIGDPQKAKDILIPFVQNGTAHIAQAYTMLIRSLILLDEPFEDYLQAWWKEPDVTVAMVHSVVNTLINNDLSKTEALLETALSRFPKNNVLLYDLAICAVQQDNREKALLLFGEIPPEERENFPLAVLLTAQEKIIQGETDEAYALIQAAEKQGLIDSHWHLHFGMAWLPKDRAKALEHYWAAVKLAPSDPTFWWKYIEVLHPRSTNKEMTFSYQQAYKATKDYKFLKAAGAFALTQEDYPQAKAFLEKAYAISPDKEIAHLLILAIFPLDDIEPIFEIAPTLSVEDNVPAPCYYAIGKSYITKKDIPNASYWVSEGLKRHPEDANLLYATGLIEVEKQNWQSAKEHFITALRIINHPNILYALGLCHLKLNEGTQALSFFLDFCEKKKNADTCYQIAMLFIHNGYTDQPRQLLEKGLQFNPDHAKSIAYLRQLQPKKGIQS